MFKKLWKTKPVKRVTLITVPIIAVLLAAVLVITQNTFVYETAAAMFGTRTMHYEGGAEERFHADYASK